MKVDLANRTRGTLYGLAWGDILGCPVEGWRDGQIREVFGSYDKLPEDYPIEQIPREPRIFGHLRPLGLHSDDTQQALALSNVCLAGWSRAVWAEWLVEGMTSGAWRGFGRNFSGAVANLRKGVVPEQAGSSSAGIGAAMRIAPLGALYHDDPDKLADVAMESSLMTHGDIRAGALAFAVACAAAMFIEGADSAEVASRLPARVAEVEAEWLDRRAGWSIDRLAGNLVSSGLERIFSSIDRGAAEIRRVVSEVARPHLAEGFTKAHPNQGFVLLGGAHGLAMALLPDANPQAVLLDVIRQGYDTDTVAAICGGVLGARFGTSWIPAHRLYDESRIDAYANALVERSAPPEDRAAFMTREVELTRWEKQYQKELGDQWLA
jgi:ADP-ribosyl-[dinitrogen reductase] hydrolase